MPARRPLEIRRPDLTMHGWTAKHYLVSAVIILLAVGMFAYGWS